MPEKRTSLLASFGLAPAGPDETAWAPSIAEGIALAQHEAPDLAPVQPYGLLSRLVGRNAQAYTSPGGTIYLDPRQLTGKTPDQVADTVLHEHAHVRQMRERGLGTLGELLHEAAPGQESYAARPDEMGAYAVERARRAAEGRRPEPEPYWREPGAWFTPGTDIDLDRPSRTVGPAIVRGL